MNTQRHYVVNATSLEKGIVGTRLANGQKNRLITSAAILATITLGLVLSTVISSPTSYAAFPGGNGKFVAMIDPDGQWNLNNFDIYVMNEKGKALQQLTNNTAFDGFPKWSPDGKKIAFSSTRDGGDNWEIYVMGANGQDQTSLTNDSVDDEFFASWSPDGTKLAVTADPSGSFDFNDNSYDRAEIYIMNVDGSHRIQLTNNSVEDYGAVWSPDGTKLAFSTRRDGEDEIYVMSADGSNPTNLTNNPAVDGFFAPSWSPDGTKLAFMSRRDGNNEIYVMNADGSNPTNLTNNSAADGGPIWSADGKWIAFRSDRDGGNNDIYLIEPTGSNLTRVTNSPEQELLYDWQSQGKK